MHGANLNDILVYVAVVEAGSFVAGAKACGLSRSAAGKAVARLEDRLGSRLLNRTTRRLSLTDEGRLFFAQGQKVLAAVDDAEASVARPGGTPRGVLRLTVPDAFGRLVVLPLIARYLTAWPEVQAEVSFSDRLADLVDEGYDLAVRIGVTAPDTSLVSRRIASYPAVVCAAPAYLGTRGTPETPEDLADHDCLRFASDGQRQGWRFRGADGAWSRAPGRGRLRLDSGAALRDAALAGLGLALLPSFLVAADLAAGRLRQVLAGHDAGAATIVTLYPSKRLLEPRVRHFIDFLVAELWP